jgi:hypothetical protein
MSHTKAISEILLGRFGPKVVLPSSPNVMNTGEYFNDNNGSREVSAQVESDDMLHGVYDKGMSLFVKNLLSVTS